MNNSDKMSSELGEFLRVAKRKIQVERHVTGRASTGRMITEVSRITGYKNAVVKEIICVFLKVVYNHLVNHAAVSLRWVGTFSFIKAHSRKVAKKKHVNADGKISWEMQDLEPTCRVRFRPTANLKKESRWFPPDEMDEELEKEKDREKRLHDYITDKIIGD